MCIRDRSKVSLISTPKFLKIFIVAFVSPEIRTLDNRDLPLAIDDKIINLCEIDLSPIRLISPFILLINLIFSPQIYLPMLFAIRQSSINN